MVVTIFAQLQLLMVTIDASITGGTEPCHQIKLYLLVFLLDSLSEDYLFFQNNSWASVRSMPFSLQTS